MFTIDSTNLFQWSIKIKKNRLIGFFFRQTSKKYFWKYKNGYSYYLLWNIGDCFEKKFWI